MNIYKWSGEYILNKAAKPVKVVEKFVHGS